MLNKILSASFSLDYGRMYVKLQPDIESKRTLVDIFTQPEMVKTIVELYGLNEADPISKYREIIINLINAMHMTILFGYPILRNKFDDYISLVKNIFENNTFDMEGKITDFSLNVDKGKDLLMYLKINKEIEKIQKKLIEEYQKIMNEKNIKIQFVPHITLMRLNDETREVVARNISDIKNFGNNLKGKQISFDNIFINAGPQKYELSV